MEAKQKEKIERILLFWELLEKGESREKEANMIKLDRTSSYLYESCYLAMTAYNENRKEKAEATPIALGGNGDEIQTVAQLR